MNVPSEVVVGPIRLRFFRPADRPAIRRICAETGFLGQPIDPVFEDRELFCDYLTAYYTDAEPESTLVVEHEGVVAGYLSMGVEAARKRRWDAVHLPLLALRGAWAYVFRPYNASSRRFVHWIVRTSRREVPAAPADLPHFHINLLPAARSIAGTRALFSLALDYLRARGAAGVYGQMSVYDDRRTERLFLRWGFRVTGRQEITKFRAWRREPVFLATLEHRFAWGGREVLSLDAEGASPPRSP